MESIVVFVSIVNPVSAKDKLYFLSETISIFSLTTEIDFWSTIILASVKVLPPKFSPKKVTPK